MRKHLLALLALLSLLSPARAADSTLAALTAGGAVGGTDLLYCTQAGADRKCTAAQIGYPTTNAACRMYRCSRQHDSENGALDGDIEGQQMEAVDACIDRHS